MGLPLVRTLLFASLITRLNQNTIVSLVCIADNATKVLCELYIRSFGSISSATMVRKLMVLT